MPANLLLPFPTAMDVGELLMKLEFSGLHVLARILCARGSPFIGQKIDSPDVRRGGAHARQKRKGRGKSRSEQFVAIGKIQVIGKSKGPTLQPQNRIDIPARTPLWLERSIFVL